MIKKVLFSLLFGSLLLTGFAYSQFSFADLSFSDEFGNSGSSDDEFDMPTDLAISDNGENLYVVDNENNRIKIYDLTSGDNCPSGTEEIIEDEVCFDDTFGSTGSSNGKFDMPTDLAIDKGGDIYVVDSDNNRVQKFESNGDFDLDFGSDDDKDDDYLGDPSAIAVHDKSDYVYVADSETDSISVFEDNGDFKFSFDEIDSGDNFDKPSGMVIDDKDEILYVADTGNHRILMFELTDDDSCPSGTEEIVEDEVCFIEEFGSKGSGDGKFDEPAGLAFDEDESILYVADTENHRIQSFEIIAGTTCPSGTEEVVDGVCFIEEFGSSGSDDGEFNSPEGLAFDEENDVLYVSDTKNNRIQMISTIGSTSDNISFSDEFGNSGSSDDEFDMPTDLAISDNGENLYVVDNENNRIKIYDLTSGDNCPSGTEEIIEDEVCFDDTFGSTGSSNGKFDMPTDLAIDKGGDIYVVDSDNNRVQKFESNGDFDLDFGSDDDKDDDYLGDPSAIAVHDKSDYVYVADSETDSISVFEDNGDFKFSFDEIDSGDNFDKPSGMVIDDKDEILYVADTGNHRILMFELTDDDSCPSGTEEIVEDEVCFIEEFGSKGSGDGKFDEPAGLAFDEDESILYVADTENHRIQSFEIIAGTTCPSGTEEVVDGVCFIEEFGSSGSDDGEFNSPEGLAFDEENDVLYVSDTKNNRIQMLLLPTGSGSSSSGSSSSGSSSSSSDEVPSAPKSLSASAASTSSIIVTWKAPELDDDVPKITGYKIEAREGTASYKTIVADTKSTSTSFLHTGLDEDESYRYKVYTINSEGTSSAAFAGPEEPGPTQTPSGLTATAISKNQISLSWIPPTDTFKQAISGYLIEREIIEDVLYEDVATVGSRSTSYTVSGLETGKEYSYVVTANLSVGNTPRSNSASATPETDSKAPTGSSAVTISSEPRNLKAVASTSQIQISWSAPSSDGNSKITGYKIEVKKDSGSYSILEDDTKKTSTSFTHSNVDVDVEYTYRVSAINDVGTSGTSTEASATPKETILELSPLGRFSVDEKRTLTFTAKTTENLLDDVTFSLEKNPAGSSINSNTGKFTWTPTDTQGAKSYTFDIVARQGSTTDKQSVTITVNDVKVEPVKEPEPKTTEPEPTAPTTDEPKELGLAGFVDKTKDPQYYVDRYNNEPTYKDWFDENYPEYDSIYQAVGLEEPVEAPAFVDPTQDPQYYVDRYNNEPTYKDWFDENYPEYDSIYQAVGLEEPVEEETPEPEIGQCGPGTKLVDGKCELDTTTDGGGCLIATATYGSEMAPQVQFLREIRDNTVLTTESGTSFMTGFNQVYYSFSPYVADYERENPAFKELVKIGITPMLASLNVMSLADSEEEILGYGIGVILMNLGMYIAAPAVVIYGINRARKVKF